MTEFRLLRIGAVCEGASDGLALRALLPRIAAAEGTPGRHLKVGDYIR